MSFEILHFSASLLDIEFTFSFFRIYFFFKVVDIFNMFKELYVHVCYKKARGGLAVIQFDWHSLHSVNDKCGKGFTVLSIVM